MAFLGYFLRRLSLVIPTLVGVTIITFTLTYVLPGNPAVVKAGPLVSPEMVKELEKEMGLDQPAWVQYWRYISGVVRGDLGQSASTGRPVLQDFKQRLPATLELTLASLLIALLIGIPAGVEEHLFERRFGSLRLLDVTGGDPGQRAARRSALRRRPSYPPRRGGNCPGTRARRRYVAGHALFSGDRKTGAQLSTLCAVA